MTTFRGAPGYRLFAVSEFFATTDVSKVVPRQNRSRCPPGPVANSVAGLYELFLFCHAVRMHNHRFHARCDGCCAECRGPTLNIRPKSGWEGAWVG